MSRNGLKPTRKIKHEPSNIAQIWCVSSKGRHLLSYKALLDKKMMLAGWFNAVEGLNDWAGGKIDIVGRPLQPPLDVKDTARAIYQKTVTRLCLLRSGIQSGRLRWLAELEWRTANAILIHALKTCVESSAGAQ